MTNSADQDPTVTLFSKTYPTGNIKGNYSSSVIRHSQNINVADRNGLHKFSVIIHDIIHFQCSL